MLQRVKYLQILKNRLSIKRHLKVQYSYDKLKIRKEVKMKKTKRKKRYIIGPLLAPCGERGERHERAICHGEDARPLYAE